MANFLINFFNWVIKGLGVVVKGLFSLLPSSPFTVIDNSSIAQYLPTLNYFLPITEIVTVGETWLACVAIYYIYQAVLRWVNFIE